MKVIVAGGRDFNDYEFMCKKLDYYFQFHSPETITIINGKGPGKPGADALAERYAKERGYPIEYFPPEWSTFGRAAGPIRNRKMAEVANALVAFPGGSGTANMISLAEEYSLKIRIVKDE